MNNSYTKQSNLVGVFFVLLFAVCFFWFYIRSVEQGLHLNLFRLAFFGFNEMNTVGFIAGAIQSYIWGYVGVGLWRLSLVLTKFR